MPKLKGLSTRRRVDHQQELITKRCKGLLAERGITQKALAEYVDVAEVTLSKQFQNGKLTLPVLIGVLMMTEADVEDKERLFKETR